mgnify:CR=1 FL=1
MARDRILPALGELELAVLQHLWQTGESDVVSTHRRVGARRGISVNTVGSTLERLHRKGLAQREKVSHAYRYTAVIDENAFRAQRVLEAAGGVAALKRDGTLAAFVDLVADVDAEALDRLEALIAARRKEAER